MPSSMRPPAPRPCESCPYRQDAPAGVWAAEEYARLPGYDRPTVEQPPKVFLCHQTEGDAPGRRLCAGWVGCHDMDESLSLRVAASQGRLNGDEVDQIRAYQSPVPLFATGQDAAFHGLAGIDLPGPDAQRVLAKLARVRGDLRT